MGKSADGEENSTAPGTLDVAAQPAMHTASLAGLGQSANGSAQSTCNDMEADAHGDTEKPALGASSEKAPDHMYVPEADKAADNSSIARSPGSVLPGHEAHSSQPDSKIDEPPPEVQLGDSSLVSETISQREGAAGGCPSPPALFRDACTGSPSAARLPGDAVGSMSSLPPPDTNVGESAGGSVDDRPASSCEHNNMTDASSSKPMPHPDTSAGERALGPAEDGSASSCEHNDVADASSSTPAPSRDADSLRSETPGLEERDTSMPSSPNTDANLPCRPPLGFVKLRQDIELFRTTGRYPQRFEAFVPAFSPDIVPGSSLGSITKISTSEKAKGRQTLVFGKGKSVDGMTVHITLLPWFEREDNEVLASVAQIGASPRSRLPPPLK